MSEEDEYLIQSPNSSPKLISGKLEAADNKTLQKNLRDSINNASQYLQKFNTIDGKFVYINYLKDNSNEKSSYNELRHSGAIYALWLNYKYNKNEKTLKTINKAVTFLQDCCVDKVPEGENMLAVWSYPYRVKSPNFREAKLGGAGLGLAALAGMNSIDNTAVDIETLRKLAKFIIYMLKDDGGYYSKYILMKGGKQNNWTSLYYPGEAALGLSMLYEIDPNPLWINSAVRIIKGLAESRKGKSEVPDDHWALLATNNIFKLSKTRKFDFPKELFIDHAVQICENVIKSKSFLNKSDNTLHIRNISSGRIAPIATTLEGVLAAYEFLPDKHVNLKTKIMEFSEKGIKFLLSSQILSGEFKGGFPSKVIYIKSGDIYKINKDIRIDYVQHAMSAMIQYLGIMKI
ncbi:MAG: hypothetical protein ACRENO_08080 [Thermodesulfobacteriota bacterium]